MNEKLLGGMVTVCSACYPGNTVFAAFPELAGLGLQVSHGICANHLRLLYPEYYLDMKKPVTTSAVTGTQ